MKSAVSCSDHGGYDAVVTLSVAKGVEPQEARFFVSAALRLV